MVNALLQGSDLGLSTMDVVSNLFALLIEASWVQLVLFFRMLDSVCSSRVSLLAEWGARI